MRVINYTQNDIDSMQIIHKGDNSIILNNGNELIKILTYFDDYPYRLIDSGSRELSYNKILLAEKYHDLDEFIALPTGIVLVDDSFAGHTMAPKIGASFATYFINGRLRVNLQKIAEIFFKKELIVKRINQKGIIIPDLASEENILIDETNDLKVCFLDYDGFQIENLSSFFISNQINQNLLLHFKKYFINKNGKMLWTPNIDKLSLITQFIYSCTCLNIPDQPNIQNEMDYFLNFIGLDDFEVREKIKILYSDSRDNVYFEDAYEKIVKLYNLVPNPVFDDETVLKFARK